MMSKRGGTFLEEAGAVFGFCHEKIPGKGEDSCCYRIHEGGALIAAFDGCGGLGAQSFVRFGGRSGAYLASRAAAAATMRWFEDRDPSSPPDVGALKARLMEAFGVCEQTARQPQAKLRGAMVRPLPSTASIIVLYRREGRALATTVSAGDSRLYILDAAGLRQLNRDDLAGEDAFTNLYHDAPMTNVVSADGAFELSQGTLELGGPCVLLAATDGCFGYLKSPMEFELLLLEALHGSQCIDEWQGRLEREIDEVAGDDQTLVGLVYGYAGFGPLRDSLSGRLEYLRNLLGGMPDTVEARREIWREYKRDYYSLAPGGAPL